MNSNEMIDVDLPSLQSIQLGYGALEGIIDVRFGRSTKQIITNQFIITSKCQ